MAGKSFKDHYDDKKVTDDVIVAEDKKRDEDDAKVRAELAKIAQIDKELSRPQPEPEQIVEEVKPKTTRKRVPAKKKVEESATEKLLKELLAERKETKDLLVGLSKALLTLSESVLKLEEKDWDLPAPIIEMKEAQQPPVVKEIIRDSKGNIKQIVETRAKEVAEE